MKTPRYINVNGRLMDLSEPQVMGILNVTPDSFYAGSRKETEKDIINRLHQITSEGASILDIGAYSSRPDAEHISAEEEMDRLRTGLDLVRKHQPEAVVSVDTFRSEIAEQAIALGAHIINDVYGGMADERMWKVIAQHKVPYILTYSEDLTAQQTADGYDYTVSQMLDFFGHEDWGKKDWYSQLYRSDKRSPYLCQNPSGQWLRSLCHHLQGGG